MTETSTILGPRSAFLFAAWSALLGTVVLVIGAVSISRGVGVLGIMAACLIFIPVAIVDAGIGCSHVSVDDAEVEVRNYWKKRAILLRDVTDVVVESRRVNLAFMLLRGASNCRIAILRTSAGDEVPIVASRSFDGGYSILAAASPDAADRIVDMVRAYA